LPNWVQDLPETIDQFTRKLENILHFLKTHQENAPENRLVQLDRSHFLLACAGSVEFREKSSSKLSSKLLIARDLTALLA